MDAFDAALAELDGHLDAAGPEAAEDEEEIHPDLAKYLDSIPAVALSTPNFCPLKWHFQRKTESPVLYLACVRMLGLAATSARNERTFSVAGHVLDELSSQLSPEMMESLILIKRNWHLLLHTVEKTITTKDSQGKPMEVKVKKQEVDWRPIVDLYIDLYGRNPEAEVEKRQKRQREADEAANANQNESDSSSKSDSGNSSSDDDGADAARQTRAGAARARREANQERAGEMAAAMPVASVCIEMNAALWPGEDANFTDGVQAVFLEESEDDEDDDIPFRVLIAARPLCAEDGNWLTDAQDALGGYESEVFIDAQAGDLTDLAIGDPEADAVE